MMLAAPESAESTEYLDIGAVPLHTTYCTRSVRKPIHTHLHSGWANGSACAARSRTVCTVRVRVTQTRQS